MAYNGKTNWQLNEIVKPEDMNRIEQGIIDAHENLLTHNADDGAHEVAFTAHNADTGSHTDIRNKIGTDISSHNTSTSAHENRFNEFVKGVTGSNATLTITKGNGMTSTVTVNNVANATNATNATKATQDSAGQQINTTYIKDLSVSGKTITYTRGNNTTGTITTQDTTYNFGGTTFYSGNGDTAEHNADNCLNNGHYYYNTNGPSTSIGASTPDGGLYTQSYSNDWVGQIAQDYRNGRLFVRGKSSGRWTSWLALLDSSNYNDYAPTKTGGGASGTWGINISGKANMAGTADTATKATQDSAGQQINTTYIKGLSISNNALIYTKGNGTTGNVDLIPAGTVQMFAGNTIPAGWLLCDGSAVSRTDYAKLFSAIGTTWGTGDGSTTFNLPNSIGRFAEGAATSGSYKSAGLPNIEGGFNIVIPGEGARETGAIHITTWSSTPGSIGAGGLYGTKGVGNMGFVLNASKSNSIYGKSSTVQPASFTTRYIIKY